MGVCGTSPICSGEKRKKKQTNLKLVAAESGERDSGVDGKLFIRVCHRHTGEKGGGLLFQAGEGLFTHGVKGQQVKSKG